MKQKKRTIGLMLTLTALLLSFLFWRVDGLYRQEKRNHALVVAIKAQNKQRVLELLDDGADANAHDTGLIPSFVQTARRLIGQFGRHHASADTVQRPSALILASRSIEFGSGDVPNLNPPDEEIVLALLDHGANPNAEEDKGRWVRSPVGYALFNGQRRALRRLLERGANPNAKAFKFPNRGGLLVGDVPLVFVFMWDDSPNEAAQLLVKHGADVNAPDSYGITSLMEATKFDNLTGVLWLLQHGAKPGVQDKHGKTALSIASENAKQEDNPHARKIRALLKQYGATK